MNLSGRYYLAIGLFLVVLIFTVMGVARYTSPPREEGGSLTKEQADKVVDELKGRLTYLSVARTDPALTLVNDGGATQEVPVAQYAITFQGDPVGEVGIFESEQYVIRIDDDPVKIRDVAKVCGAVDQMLEEKDEILRALKDSKVSYNLSLGFFGTVGYEFTPPKKMLFELIATLRQLTGLKAKKVEVLIRGFADGQRRPWKRALREDYPFDTVSVYMPLEPQRLNWLEYVRKETPVPIDNPYANKDLPELRARFVKEELIDKVLAHCDSYAKPEVHILKGRADEEWPAASKRKALFFVNVY
jgi:hypothetical protein